jgi:hypothetical protein
MAQAKQYLGKADEFLASAADDRMHHRVIAATSSAGHPAFNAGHVMGAVRSGKRSAGDAHGQSGQLLRTSRADGVELAKELARRLVLNPKAEYDPSDIALGTARQAVERADRCVAIARRVLASRL